VDDYSFVVYDYRDSDKIGNATSDLMKSAEVTIKSSSKYVQPGEKVWADVGFNIMCGSLNSSYIKLDLPDLSLDNLNLRNYNVDYYDVTERYKDSDLQKQYEEAIKAWEQDVHYEERTGTRTVTEIIEPAKPGLYTDKYVLGEKKGKITVQEPVPAKTQTHTENYTYRVPVRGPMPTPPQGEKEIVKRYAPSSLNLMDEAIDQVSKMRVLLGTQQNRLEYAYNINNNTSENTQAAESRVRDTDMAKEMVSYSKSNILAQAAQSMLTQTNQQPQGILALLQ
jgi:flagellin-like hook-associated protein FlgL